MVLLTDKQHHAEYVARLKAFVETEHALCATKFVRLGSRIVRVLCYSPEFLPLMQKQLTYTLCDSADRFDATLVVWREPTPEARVADFMRHAGLHARTRLRLEALRFRLPAADVEFVDPGYSRFNPVMRILPSTGFVEVCAPETNTYYYGVKDLSPEEFIKQGHLFVQYFNKIAKTPTSNLVHGAVVGMDGNGILFCARGQRGKSTLAVLAMMEGFEYVSDDYLILEREGREIYSYPIYSIITLSPRMYNELYDDLRGKFVCNNARKDKYVINIADYHGQFRTRYPIRICMFPQIVDDPEPGIVPFETGRAITQLIHSTIRQTQDEHDIRTVKKLVDFLKDFPCYEIRLCNDIRKNVACLRTFCETTLRHPGAGQ